MTAAKLLKIKRFLRFQIVSVGGTLVNMGVLWLMYRKLELPLVIASACAIEAAIIHNFTWHYFITWKDRIKKHTVPDYFKRLLHYNIITASIDFIVNISILKLLVKYTDMHFQLANIFGMLACPMFKFMANEFLIFKHKLIHPHDKDKP